MDRRAGRRGAGLTAQAYRPAALAWVVELTPKDRQVIVFSVLRLTFNVGTTVGPVGAALLLAYSSYDALFYVDAATSLAFGVLAYVALRSNPELPAGRRRRATASAPDTGRCSPTGGSCSSSSASSSPPSPTSRARPRCRCSSPAPGTRRRCTRRSSP
ncbi:MFS transporter [Actinomadura luteofluorescens]|uniref:MFS transporter n=1 Tax=Actinomadura luteofluorescens TaxID=46163 RepID=UPI0036314E66